MPHHNKRVATRRALLYLGLAWHGLAYASAEYAVRPDAESLTRVPSFHFPAESNKANRLIADLLLLNDDRFPDGGRNVPPNELMHRLHSSLTKEKTVSAAKSIHSARSRKATSAVPTGRPRPLAVRARVIEPTIRAAVPAGPYDELTLAGVPALMAGQRDDALALRAAEGPAARKASAASLHLAVASVAPIPSTAPTLAQAADDAGKAATVVAADGKPQMADASGRIAISSATRSRLCKLFSLYRRELPVSPGEARGLSATRGRL
jgi:hypothetical protein